VTVSPELDVEIWREREQWLERLRRRRIERERWTARDWLAAKQIADAAWVVSPEGLYAYQAERAIREYQNHRTDEQLAAWARFDDRWLCELLERTAP
jgi:hypothetical protein